jgi:hypothetical protein
MKKVIKVYGVKSETIRDSFDVKYLFPKDTIRKVKIFTLFYGWIETLESCTIEYIAGSDGTIYYNKWKKINIDSNVLSRLT